MGFAGVASPPAASEGQAPVAPIGIAVDSSDETAPRPAPAVFGVRDGALLSSVRVGSIASPPSYEQVVQAARSIPPSAADGGAESAEWAEFVSVNRDLLDYRMLYRLTAEKERAANSGNAAGSAELEALRVPLVRATQRFDAPMYTQVEAAEARLGELLSQPAQPRRAAVVRAAAGGTAPQLFGFWVVLLAAVSAWESKLGAVGTAGLAEAKLEELAEIRDVLETPGLARAGGYDKLTALLRSLPNYSNSSGLLLPGQEPLARARLDELEPDPALQLSVVRAMGCLSCLAQRHGFQAYNPLAQQAAALYDVLLRGRAAPLEGQDTRSPAREVSSRLVQMANDADGTVAPEVVGLWW